MSHAEMFVQLSALMADLTELSDEEALNEMVRRIRAKEVYWFPVVQPLLIFAAQCWRECGKDIRASLAITAEDERLLRGLPSKNNAESIFPTHIAHRGIVDNDPNTLRTLLLCISITRHVLNVTS